MADSIWYYARGESEQGPISTAQIKALAATGALRRDDLVWKEGMENWLPASDVYELFPQTKKQAKTPENKAAPATQEKDTPAPAPVAVRPSLPPDLDVTQLIRSVGRGLVVVGVLIALMSRGCDSLGGRKVARLQELAASSETEFQRSWDHAKLELEDQFNALSERSDLNPAEKERINSLRDAISKLESDRTDERQTLRQGKWAGYKTAAEDCESNNRMWAYWRRLALLFGTMALALGLLLVTPTTEGPERWICLVMLSVILYSVYAGNSVWNDP